MSRISPKAIQVCMTEMEFKPRFVFPLSNNLFFSNRCYLPKTNSLHAAPKSQGMGILWESVPFWLLVIPAEGLLCMDPGVSEVTVTIILAAVGEG